MTKKKPSKESSGTKSKKAKSAPKDYYFGKLKKEKIKDVPVYGWPGGP